MSRAPNDLLLVIALAALGLVVALLPGTPALISAPLAVALVLALPGYALIAALDPQRATGGIERLTVCLGVSLIIVILVGLALNLTPWGLQRQAWGIALSTITIGAAAAALARRRSAAPADSVRRPALRLRPAQIALFALAVLLLANAAIMARSGAISQPANGFTQLWMVPIGSAATDTVRLGVRNQEPQPMSYRLRVTDRGRVLGEWPNLDLQPGAQWEITLVLPNDLDSAIPVEAALYRTDDPGTIYRSTQLWPGAATPTP